MLKTLGKILVGLIVIAIPVWMVAYAYDWVSSGEHPVQKPAEVFDFCGTIESDECGNNVYSNETFGVKYVCDPYWQVLGLHEIPDSDLGSNEFLHGVNDLYVDTGNTWVWISVAYETDAETIKRHLDNEKDFDESEMGVEMGAQTEMVDMPLTVGDTEFEGVRIYRTYSDGSWSLDRYAYIVNDKKGFIIRVEGPDDWSVDNALSRLQPL